MDSGRIGQVLLNLLHNAINSDDDAPTIARKLMQEKIRALVETTGSVDRKSVV